MPSNLYYYRFFQMLNIIYGENNIYYVYDRKNVRL